MTAVCGCGGGRKRATGGSKNRGRQANKADKRCRKNYVWAKATRQPENQQFLGTAGPTELCNVENVDDVMEIVTKFLPEEVFYVCCNAN